MMAEGLPEYLSTELSDPSSMQKMSRIPLKPTVSLQAEKEALHEHMTGVPAPLHLALAACSSGRDYSLISRLFHFCLKTVSKLRYYPQECVYSYSIHPKVVRIEVP